MNNENIVTLPDGEEFVVDLMSIEENNRSFLGREAVRRSDLSLVRDETWREGVRKGALTAHEPSLSPMSVAMGMQRAAVAMRARCKGARRPRNYWRLALFNGAPRAKERAVPNQNKRLLQSYSACTPTACSTRSTGTGLLHTHATRGGVPNARGAS